MYTESSREADDSFARLLVVLAGYFFTFMITPLDLAWHLNTSLGSLCVQLWLSFVLLAFSLPMKSKKGKKARAG